MKRSVAMLLAVLVGGACSTADDGGVVDAGPDASNCIVDLNYTIPTGVDLVVGSDMETLLCPARDQDFFRFDVPNPRTIVQVRASMTTNITELTPSYTILRDDGTELGQPTGFTAAATGLSAGQAPSLVGTHLMLEAGAYVLVMRDAAALDNGFDVANAVTFSVSLLPEPDANEPNNRTEDATALTGTPIDGQIATLGDVDVFAVDVRAGNQAIVDVRLDAPAATATTGVAHVVTVLGSDGMTTVGAQIASTEPPVAANRQGTRGRFAVAGGGRYYVRVAAVDPNRSELDAALGRYTLTVTTLDEPDANEGAISNDLYSTATQASTGTDLQASLASLGDQDVYGILVSASVAQPKVLIATIDITGSDTFVPQITIIGADPEAPPAASVCNASCTSCSDGVCLRPRMQRFVASGTFRVGFPLRGALYTYVVVNELDDDGYQEDAGYRIRFEVIDDPDPGEAGDDYLLANLESAGYANEDELREQFRESRDRARPAPIVFPLVCGDEGADPATCLPLVPVPNPSDDRTDEQQQVVDCSQAPDGNISLEGRLAYEGDRDYFWLDVPSRGYWGIDVNYEATGVGTTPVELTVFIHADQGLIMSFLESEPVEGVNCEAGRDCPAGTLCIDGNCWSDGPSNPSFTNRAFPTGNACSLVDVIDERPVLVEVTDNGINDFDPDLRYRLNASIRCGCPTACDGDIGDGTRCQGIPAP
jgi:hypothetical protein